MMHRPTLEASDTELSSLLLAILYTFQSFPECFSGPSRHLRRLSFKFVLRRIFHGPNSHINERIEYKLLSLAYKTLATAQPSYLHSLISVQ